MHAPGPFRPDQLPPSSEYELDRGHPIHVMPTLPRGGSAQLDGSLVIGTDPSVGSAGVEVGFDLGHNTLRAPDLAVLPAGPPDQWAKSAPPLAIEYADRGQDEADLRQKIGQLLDAGTLAVWVVRLHGPQRVEVHESTGPVRVVTAEGELALPGVLSQPIPAAALFDREVAHRVALRNLLARFGYRHPDDAFAEGRDAGLAEGRLIALREAVRLVLVARGEAEAAQASVEWGEEQLLAALSRG
jgi:Putative restriction endonuclease